MKAKTTQFKPTRSLETADWIVGEMGEQPLYIFDLDGTLADVRHRLGMWEQRSTPGKEEQFHQACAKDEPILHTIATLEILRQVADIHIWTGRSDVERTLTLAWLEKHTSFMEEEIDPKLLMRPEGNRIVDVELKRNWLRSMPAKDRTRLVGVFEDRTRVVDMWRAEGVHCFQVAEGDY